MNSKPQDDIVSIPLAFAICSLDELFAELLVSVVLL